MSNRAIEIGNQILWILGHALFTLVTVCAVRGGYQFFQDYKATEPIQIDVTQLTDDDRAELSKQIFLAGQEAQEKKSNRHNR